VLGHGDVHERAEPCRIESLSRIERIAAGSHRASAAVDEQGQLFTWGKASLFEEEGDSDSDAEQAEIEGPSGLGYELDEETVHQQTPKRVDALSQDRVVGVALGYGFTLTLAVTDAGVVFSFGSCREGELGRGSLEIEVLPRRIEALAQTERRFVDVAAGHRHALALTEWGEVYGWGHGEANGHGCEERGAHAAASGRAHQSMRQARECRPSQLVCCDDEGRALHLGRQQCCDGLHGTPTRVARLSGVEVAAVAICWMYTLVADAHGVVWDFGQRVSDNLDASGPEDNAGVRTPIPIPTLRVRVLNSP